MAEIATQTDRLILRRTVPDDFDWWLKEMNTPAVTHHLGGVISREAVEAKFVRTAAQFDQHGFGFWIVACRSRGIPMGNCGLAVIDNAAARDLCGKVHMGWSFAQSFWRQGFAYEAAQAVLTLGFGTYGLDVIHAQTTEHNVASWRLMEKLGMERAEQLDYVDPEYPPEENPTIIYRASRP